jgi:hypothetical protein
MKMHAWIEANLGPRFAIQVGRGIDARRISKSRVGQVKKRALYQRQLTGHIRNRT